MIIAVLNVLALLGRIWQSLSENASALWQMKNAVSALETRVTQLEVQMASESDVIARIDTFTTHLSGTVASVAQELKDLRAAVESGNQTAISAAMDRLAPSIDKLEEVGSQLDALASDPSDPVPDPGPVAEPGEPGNLGARFRR